MPTPATWICLCTLGIEVVLSLNSGGISPWQQVLEECAWVIETVWPACPWTDIANWPSEDHREVLATTTPEWVCTKVPRIYFDIQQIETKAFHKWVGQLSGSQRDQEHTDWSSPFPVTIYSSTLLLIPSSWIDSHYDFPLEYKTSIEQTQAQDRAKVSAYPHTGKTVIFLGKRVNTIVCLETQNDIKIIPPVWCVLQKGSSILSLRMPWYVSTDILGHRFCIWVISWDLSVELVEELQNGLINSTSTGHDFTTSNLDRLC